MGVVRLVQDSILCDNTAAFYPLSFLVCHPLFPLVFCSQVESPSLFPSSPMMHGTRCPLTISCHPISPVMMISHTFSPSTMEWGSLGRLWTTPCQQRSSCSGGRSWSYTRRHQRGQSFIQSPGNWWVLSLLLPLPPPILDFNFEMFIYFWLY